MDEEWKAPPTEWSTSPFDQSLVCAVCGCRGDLVAWCDIGWNHHEALTHTVGAFDTYLARHGLVRWSPLPEALLVRKNGAWVLGERPVTFDEVEDSAETSDIFVRGIHGRESLRTRIAAARRSHATGEPFWVSLFLVQGAQGVQG
jgi:hypothetical protein